MPKMHYFRSVGRYPLRFWWPKVTWCGQILFFQLLMTKSNFKKSAMTSF